MTITITGKNIAIFLLSICLLSISLIFAINQYKLLQFRNNINLITIQPQEDIIKNALYSIKEQDNRKEVHKNTIALLDYTNAKSIEYAIEHFNLSSSQKDELMDMYFKKRQTLIYQFNERLKLKEDVIHKVNEVPFVNVYKNLNSVKEHSGLLASAACDIAFLGFRLAEKSTSVSGEMVAAGLCPTVMTVVAEPIVKALEEAAFLEDVNTFIIANKSETEKSILELGTASNTKEFDVSVSDGYKLFWWEQSSTLNGSLQVVTKIGFDLTNDDFVIKLDTHNHQLHINLPEPRIISQEKNWKFGEKTYKGLFPPMGNNLHTEMQNKVNNYTKSIDTTETEMMAKLNVQSALTHLYAPVLSALDSNKYSILITYGEDNKPAQIPIEPEEEKGFIKTILEFFA